MSLKEMYGLIYDNSGYDSGLVRWYNDLIDKSYGQLDATDVSKMMHQNILMQVATERAIDLFINDPFCGEFYDGELLDVIISQEVIVKLRQEVLDGLRLFLKSFKAECFSEWSDEETRRQYLGNLDILKTILRM